jgi:hypothetical protein
MGNEDKQRLYTGHSGQMAVMAELLFRQCNVAVPDVDYGTDVFAFRDDREDVARVQVKTAQGKRYVKGKGYRAQFGIPMKQLGLPDSPPLYYALAVRLDGQWVDFIVISRERLAKFWDDEARFSTENHASGDLVITVRFRLDRVTCGEVDLTEFRNAWDQLPPLCPPQPLTDAL